MKFKVTLKDFYDSTLPRTAPEIFETYCTTIPDAIDEYCYKNCIQESEILSFEPMVVSKDGIGHYGEGLYEQHDDYHDRPRSAFNAHTVHPKRLVNSLWRDSNNRYSDHVFKITEVVGEHGEPLNPFDLTQWEVEYVEIDPCTNEIVRGDFLGINPTYKRMNLANFMNSNHCIKLT